MTIKTSRRFFLSGVGALAMAALSGPVSAQDVISEILQSERRGNWDDTFDARASQGDKVASNLPIFSPQTVMYIEQAVAQYSGIVAQGGWPMVPATKKLQLGVVDPDVVALRKRLMVSGDLSTSAGISESFDTYVDAAVKRFQARHGLSETGSVGPLTFAALNVPAETRVRQLAASMERLAGTSFIFGQRYVVVNIPAAVVEAVANGRVERRYVAVVGKPDRPSPTLTTNITAVNLNPTWTVPVSLIRKDIIPHVRKDPAYLAKMKIRIFDGKGQEVDPQTLDWSTEKAVNYTLRQDPGEINSLGQIRIDMPNKHAVYMHDTPKKRLFAQDVRFHSSGCVRVADVGSFVEWLLHGTAGPKGPWTKPEIDAAIATTARQDIRLDKPVPVAWVYLTGYATPDGTAHFRNDVYGLDTPRIDLVPDTDLIDVPVTSSIAPRRS
jgi:murein L,D-transpeptidase YcbB/YkuD